MIKFSWNGNLYQVSDTGEVYLNLPTGDGCSDILLGNTNNRNIMWVGDFYKTMLKALENSKNPHPVDIY